VLISAAAFFFVPAASAEDISVVATVENTTVELSSSLQLTITVNGLQSLAPITLPEIDGFQSRFLGPSTRVAVVNGSFSSSIAFLYRLYPQKTGKFTIPALQINIQGKDYATRPISVEVVPDGNPADSAGESTAAVSRTLNDQLFVRLFAPKDTVFIGERVPIVARLYVGGVSIRDGYFSQFEHTGFMADDFKKVKEYPQVINGINFQVAEYLAFVYPTRTGSLTLGPLSVACNIRVKASSRSRMAAGSDAFFGDDFFDNFFSGYDVRPFTVESTPLRFTVRDLPSEGRPVGFNGAVGNFDFSLTAGPAEVKAGDPVTVKMRISGEGNMKTVRMPEFGEQSGIKNSFKLYDAEVSEKDGEQVAEQVLIPLNERAAEVPAISFSFFNPESGQYKTITRGPIPLRVSPAPASAVPVTASALPLAGVEPAPEKIGEDIVFIKSMPGNWQPRGLVVWRSGLFLVLLFLILGFWSAGYFSFRWTHRLRTDTRFARRMRAPRQARAGMAAAQKYLNSGAQKEFYDTVFKTLQDYLGNKFHLPAGSITVDTVAGAIGINPRKEKIIAKIKAVWNECEIVRYGQAPLDKAKMSDCFTALVEIIEETQRN